MDAICNPYRAEYLCTYNTTIRIRILRDYIFGNLVQKGKKKREICAKVHGVYFEMWSIKGICCIINLEGVTRKIK